MKFYAIKDIKKNKLVCGIYLQYGKSDKYLTSSVGKPPILFDKKEQAEFEIWIYKLGEAKYKVVELEVKECENENP